MLYRLVAVTAAGMYAIAALHAPDGAGSSGSGLGMEAEASTAPNAGAIEVSRSAFAALGFTLDAPRTAVTVDGPSEREAIRIAMERGRAIREEREAADKGVVLASLGRTRVEAPAADAQDVATSAPETPTGVWTVTGSAVNLRAGPGTNHPVVGQMDLGDLAIPLGETGGDWIRIEPADGGSEAWIFARFLEPAQG